MLNKGEQIWRKGFQPTDKDFYDDTYSKTLSFPCCPGATKSQCAWLSCRSGQWGALVHEGQTTQSSFLVFIGKSYKLVISSSPHRQASLSTFSPVGLLLLPQSLCRLNRRFVGIKSFCKSNPFIFARLCKSNPFIWFQVLSLAVDLYQHCYWEVTIGRDMWSSIISFFLKEGDVELMKAWLSDLSSLGVEIPHFDKNQNLIAEDHSCNEKVQC